MVLDGKRVLITGGTGSLGRTLVRRMLSGELGRPMQVTVFSRDEAKQHAMRMDYLRLAAATDDVIFRGVHDALQFRIGDVRDLHSVHAALRDADIVFNAAALKQVPTCEYFPFEAVQTNVVGAENIVRCISEQHLPVETVIGISTDKACKPVNVMGMTKALQERIFIQANLRCPDTRFVCARYGNVLASRGSVIPLFLDQIHHGGPVTITSVEMTRFLLTLDQAADTVIAALKGAKRGETFIPRIPSSRMTDIAEVLIGERPIETVITGVRPGEKLHEILISEEECQRAAVRDQHYAILPILPELREEEGDAGLTAEYSSADYVMGKAAVGEFLSRHRLTVETADRSSVEAYA